MSEIRVTEYNMLLPLDLYGCTSATDAGTSVELRVQDDWADLALAVLSVQDATALRDWLTVWLERQG